MNSYINKIKNFISEHPIIDYFIIAAIVIIYCCLFSNHLTIFFADKGREFLIPEEILNGKVPYKDITLIYFPTVYYINALIYKILGVSMNSLAITQGFLDIIFMFLNYSCARFFLNRKDSLLLSILTISSCIFSFSDLFAFNSPYSYARSYGIAIFTLCTFLLIKLYRTDKLKYLYIAALMSGLCFIFKFEFFIVYVLLCVAMLLYKKLSIIQYLKVFALSLVFPLILSIFLYFQGIGINDIINAAEFGYSFSKTEAMTKFLSITGMYPMGLISEGKAILNFESYFIGIILSCFFVLKLNTKYKKIWIIPCFTVIIWKIFYEQFRIMQFWVLLPLLIFVVLCFKFKELLKENKELLLFIIASLIISQRCFFLNSISAYGIYSFPLLIISLYVIVKKYLPSVIFNIKTERITHYIIVVLIGLYLINNFIKFNISQFPIITKKGTIYTDLYDFDLMDGLLTYIEQKTDKNATILVLQEGHIVNFLTDRKTNLKCHMMDRLYHDAYGEAKAMDMIASTNAEYIILIKGVKHNDFYYPYLYDESASLSGKYIAQNYANKKEFSNKLGKISVLQKINK